LSFGGRATVIWILFGLTPFLVGCRRATTWSRLPVHGTVTLPGGDKISGSITFLPEKGQTGPAANATLTEGNYQFDRNNGPVAGPHTVMVRRLESRSRTLRTQADIPSARMKSLWTRSVELSDDGTYLQDFQLD
jgi:hypothetical protein